MDDALKLVMLTVVLGEASPGIEGGRWRGGGISWSGWHLSEVVGKAGDGASGEDPNSIPRQRTMVYQVEADEPVIFCLDALSLGKCLASLPPRVCVS